MNLSDICELIVDCLHSTAYDQGHGYALIRTPNIGRGRFILEGVHRVSEKIYSERNKRAIPQNDDLIFAREAPAGNVAIIKNGEKMCLGQRTVLIRPNSKKVYPLFLCYYLLAPLQQHGLLSTANGATVAHVNMSAIRNLKICLPSSGTQQKIASILSAYDDFIENNRPRIQLLEESARQIYKEWFVRLRFPGHEHLKVVDGVPEGWKRKPLGEVAPFHYGKALTAENRHGGDVPVYASSGQVGTHNKALVKAPGIVIGRKGNVGSVYWVSKDYYPIDTTYYIKPESADLFIYYAVHSINFINTDVAVPGLNRDYAHSRNILIPDKTTLSNFLELVTALHSQIDNLNAQNNKLAQARDLLLPKLMSGEVVV